MKNHVHMVVTMWRRIQKMDKIKLFIGKIMDATDWMYDNGCVIFAVFLFIFPIIMWIFAGPMEAAGVILAYMCMGLFVLLILQ